MSGAGQHQRLGTLHNTCYKLEVLCFQSVLTNASSAVAKQTNAARCAIPWRLNKPQVWVQPGSRNRWCRVSIVCVRAPVHRGEGRARQYVLTNTKGTNLVISRKRRICERSLRRGPMELHPAVDTLASELELTFAKTVASAFKRILCMQRS